MGVAANQWQATMQAEDLSAWGGPPSRARAPRVLEIQFFSLDEVARATRLHEDTIRRAVTDGELAAYKLRGQLRIRDRDLDAWINTRRLRRKDVVTEPVRFSAVETYEW